MHTDYNASYLRLLQNGELSKRVELAKKHLTNCYLCPHECSINRKEELGFCRSPDKVILASYGPHFGEESVGLRLVV